MYSLWATLTLLLMLAVRRIVQTEKGGVSVRVTLGSDDDTNILGCGDASVIPTQVAGEGPASICG